MSQTQPPRFSLRWLTVWAVILMVVVVALLVWPSKVDGPLVTLVRAAHASFGFGSLDEAVRLAGVLANVLLFVPVGFIVGLATRRWWLGLAIGVAISAGSELVQLALPSRVASVEDVIANSLGAALGAGIALAALAHRRSAPHPAGAPDSGAEK